MVLTHPFYCPTRIIDGVAFDEAAETLVGGRSWVLVTSPSWIMAGVDRRLADRLGPPKAIIGDVKPNPTVSEMLRISALLPDGVDAVIALGGGSVIDATKGMLAVTDKGIGKDGAMNHLRQGEPLQFESPLPQLIAVPTTSGTGSEVTRWGTIWGDDGIKFSINDPLLYPSHALLDPALCLTMPRELTLATALDAVSHAMESIWNRRHSEVSDGLAVQAIRLVRRHLQGVLAEPDNLDGRQKIQSASVLAGLAMGTTQTALAHSISYPFTSRFGMPHGLACSFTLPVIAAFNGETAVERLSPIADALECDIGDIADTLTAWFHAMELGAHLSKYVDRNSVEAFDDQLITRARAANNIRDVDGVIAKDLARKALLEFVE
jgi:alcohol dehydrogenase